MSAKPYWNAETENQAKKLIGKTKSETAANLVNWIIDDEEKVDIGFYIDVTEYILTK